MIVAWVLFPLVLLAVCVGCGLAVERVAGWRLPGALIASMGLALVIVTATLLTYEASTAPFTTAAVVALALVGYVSSTGRIRQLRLEPWTLAVGLSVFAVLAAPVVLSGNAAFLGYFVLNDAAVHFELINQLLAHGRDLSGVPSSGLSAVLHSYVGTDYPIGSQVALGAIRPLVAQNVAWIFQPYIAVILSLGAVALYQLLDGVVRSRPLRALCAFVAAQPGLVYAFYLEASIKELATTWILTLLVLVVLATLRGKLGPRRLVPLAIVTVAALDILDLAIVPWVGVPLAVFAVLAAWRERDAVRRAPKRRLALTSAGCVLALAVIAAPIIASARTFFNVATGVLTQTGELGNLVTPLLRWQMLGIWPSGDFRFAVVNHYRVTYALLGVALVSALLGAAWAVRRRAAAPLLLLAGNGIAALYLLSRGSPYANAKVMAIFSLTVMLMVMLGAVALHDSGRRLEGWGLAVLVAGGVLWTNALAYRGVSVAPRARLAELASIGNRFAGQGPTFYNESDEFAIDFLGADAPTDPALGAPTPRAGLAPRLPQQLRLPWDPDELDESYLQSFPLLVLGRSPLDSRPPANYQLAYRGRFYEVWRRTSTPYVLEHVALGGALDPAAVPSCDSVMALASRAAREQARLAYVVGAPLSTLVPTHAKRPKNWGEVSGEPRSLIPRQEAGAIVGTVRVQASGRYTAWLQGSFSRPVQLWIDGRKIGSASYELGPPGQSVPIGELSLRAGSHRISIVVPGKSLAPGVTLANQTLGPLTLVPSSDAQPVGEVDPADARSLCGRSLDWIEIVR
jgi:hypothetical protein